MTKPKVVVTNRIFPETRSLLTAACDVVVNEALEPWNREEILAHSRDADALMVFMTDRIDAAFLAACPRLRVIGAALKGYDNIEAQACARAGVQLSIVPDLLTAPTAELAIALMLAVGRQIRQADAAIRSEGFAGWRPRFYGVGLAGASVGILGFGSVGQAIARRLLAFDCRVLVSDGDAARASKALERLRDHGSFADTLALCSPDDIFPEVDFLVLALPLTAETQHIVNRRPLARMKAGAFLVNPARGSLVDEAAVADALESGHLAGYAADVFECEDWAREARPGQIEARLLRPEAPTVLTPHLGSAVTAARREIEAAAAGSILDGLAGQRPRHVVAG